MPALRKPRNSKKSSPDSLRNVKQILAGIIKHIDYDTQGLYRLSGEAAKVKELSTKVLVHESSMKKLLSRQVSTTTIFNPDSVKNEIKENPHCWMGVLKEVLKEEFPKIEFELQTSTQQFQTIYNAKKTEGTSKQFRDLFKSHIEYLIGIEKLDEAEILHDIFHLYHKIQKRSSVNDMNSSNIAKIAFPRFNEVFYDQSQQLSFENKDFLTDLLTVLIESPIFEKDFSHRYSKPCSA